YHQADFAYRGAKTLFADTLISLQEYEVARTNYQSIKKRYELLQKTTEKNIQFKEYQAEQLTFSSSLISRSLSNLRSSLDNLVVKAPESGLLTGLQIEVGQHINKGEKVAEIDLKQGYRLNALVDEIYISRIRKGLEARTSFGGKEYKL